MITRKRNRIPLSCSFCRSKKKKCDKKRPRCSYCLHHNNLDCQYQYTVGSSSKVRKLLPQELAVVPEYIDLEKTGNGVDDESENDNEHNNDPQSITLSPTSKQVRIVPDAFHSFVTEKENSRLRQQVVELQSQNAQLQALVKLQSAIATETNHKTENTTNPPTIDSIHHQSFPTTLLNQITSKLSQPPRSTTATTNLPYSPNIDPTESYNFFDDRTFVVVRANCLTNFKPMHSLYIFCHDFFQSNSELLLNTYYRIMKQQLKEVELNSDYSMLTNPLAAQLNENFKAVKLFFLVKRKLNHASPMLNINVKLMTSLYRSRKESTWNTPVVRDAGQINEQARASLIKKIEAILPRHPAEIAYLWQIFEKFVYPFLPTIDLGCFKKDIELIIVGLRLSNLDDDGKPINPDLQVNYTINLTSFIDLALIGNFLVILRLSYLAIKINTEFVSASNDEKGYAASIENRMINFATDNLQHIGTEYITLAFNCVSQAKSLTKSSISVVNAFAYLYFYFKHSEEYSGSIDEGERLILLNSLLSMTRSIGIYRDWLGALIQNEGKSHPGVEYHDLDGLLYLVRKLWHAAVDMDSEEFMISGNPVSSVVITKGLRVDLPSCPWDDEYGRENFKKFGASGNGNGKRNSNVSSNNSSPDININEHDPSNNASNTENDSRTINNAQNLSEEQKDRIKIAKLVDKNYKRKHQFTNFLSNFSKFVYENEKVRLIELCQFINELNELILVKFGDPEVFFANNANFGTSGGEDDSNDDGIKNEKSVFYGKSNGKAENNNLSNNDYIATNGSNKGISYGDSESNSNRVDNLVNEQNVQKIQNGQNWQKRLSSQNLRQRESSTANQVGSNSASTTSSFINNINNIINDDDDDYEIAGNGNNDSNNINNVGNIENSNSSTNLNTNVSTGNKKTNANVGIDITNSNDDKTLYYTILDKTMQFDQYIAMQLTSVKLHSMVLLYFEMKHQQQNYSFYLRHAMVAIGNFARVVLRQFTIKTRNFLRIGDGQMIEGLVDAVHVGKNNNTKNKSNDGIDTDSINDTDISNTQNGKNINRKKNHSKSNKKHAKQLRKKNVTQRQNPNSRLELGVGMGTGTSLEMKNFNYKVLPLVVKLSHQIAASLSSILFRVYVAVHLLANQLGLASRDNVDNRGRSKGNESGGMGISTPTFASTANTNSRSASSQNHSRSCSRNCTTAPNPRPRERQRAGGPMRGQYPGYLDAYAAEEKLDALINLKYTLLKILEITVKGHFFKTVKFYFQSIKIANTLSVVIKEFQTFAKLNDIGADMKMFNFDFSSATAAAADDHDDNNSASGGRNEKAKGKGDGKKNSKKRRGKATVTPSSLEGTGLAHAWMKEVPEDMPFMHLTTREIISLNEILVYSAVSDDDDDGDNANEQGVAYNDENDDYGSEDEDSVVEFHNYENNGGLVNDEVEHTGVGGGDDEDDKSGNYLDAMLKIVRTSCLYDTMNDNATFKDFEFDSANAAAEWLQGHWSAV